MDEAREAASPSQRRDGGGDRQAGWADAFWLAVVAPVDALLRAYYGIEEFTDDPRCLFRIAFDIARRPLRLSDGTQIRAGDRVGALHLWNEHLRREPGRGPDLAWAGEIRRRLQLSLGLLAEFVERDPAWRSVPAFIADARLSGRLATAQMRRLASSYGFTLTERGPSLLRMAGGSIAAWALTRAFNPAALPHQPFLRARHELWLSRSTLLQRYGRPMPSAALQAAQMGRVPDQS